MRKRHFITVFFIFCGLNFSFSQIMFKSKGSYIEPSFSLRYGEGARSVSSFNTTLQETKYDISQLIMFNLKSKIFLSKDFSLGVNIAKNVTTISGGSWSEQYSSGLSITSDVEVSEAYDYDFFISTKIPFKNFQVSLGFKEIFFKWDAFGGTQSDNTEIFSKSNIASTYQQKINIPYIGLFYTSAEYFRGAFFEFSGTYSPFVSVSDQNIDHIANARQFGTFDQGQYYSATANINQPLSEHAYLKLGASYHKLDKFKGDSKEIVYSGNTATTTIGNSATVSNSFLDVSLALGFSF